MYCEVLHVQGGSNNDFGEAVELGAWRKPVARQMASTMTAYFFIDKSLMVYKMDRKSPIHLI